MFIDALAERPKNAGGRVALPPGRFGSIRKIYGHGLLKTSRKIVPKYVWTIQNMSGQPKMCPDTSRFVRTVQDMSRQFNMCLDSSKYGRSRKMITHFLGMSRKMIIDYALSWYVAKEITRFSSG